MLTKSLNFFHPKRGMPPSPWLEWFLWGFLAFCMAFLPLVNAWLGYFISSGPEGMMAMMGGAIPYSDAGGYMEGAAKVLYTGQLDEWNMRRPLNALFFAFRWFLSGGNIWGAFCIQNAFFAVSLMVYFVYLARVLGRWPTLFGALIILEYSFQYTHTTLSEILGLTLGLASFTLLWGGWVQKNRLLYIVGLGVLTIALSCRAGPNFLLPALMGLLFVFPLTPHRYRDFLVACGVALGCFIFMSQISSWYKNPLAVGQFYGNFSHTLFGLVSGGKKWVYAFQDPVISLMIKGKPEGEVANLLYRASLKVFLNSPFKVVLGVIRNVAGYLFWMAQFPTRILSLPILVGIGLSIPFFLYGAWRFFKLWGRERRACFFSLFAVAGILASASVVWVDGGIRTFAVAMPFLGFIGAFTFSSRVSVTECSKMILGWDVSVVVLIVGGALLAPWLANFSGFIYKNDQRGAMGEENVVQIAHPSQQLYVIIEKDPSHLGWHTISEKKLMSHCSFYEETGNDLEKILMTEKGPFVIFASYDRRSQSVKRFLAPAALLETPFSQAWVTVAQKGHFLVVQSWKLQ